MFITTTSITYIIFILIVYKYSYWLGSQMAPPMYQYRLVLSQDDKLLNVATDCDFNIEGEVRLPVTSNIASKTKFLVRMYVCMYVCYYYWL